MVRRSSACVKCGMREQGGSGVFPVPIPPYLSQRLLVRCTETVTEQGVGQGSPVKEATMYQFILLSNASTFTRQCNLAPKRGEGGRDSKGWNPSSLSRPAIVATESL